MATVGKNGRRHLGREGALDRGGGDVKARTTSSGFSIRGLITIATSTAMPSGVVRAFIMRIGGPRVSGA